MQPPSIVSMSTHLRVLIEAHAIRTLRPRHQPAEAHYCLQWHLFRMAYPHVASGRLEAIVYEHAATWIREGSCQETRRQAKRGILRAKKLADEKAEMDAIRVSLMGSASGMQVAS